MMKHEDDNLFSTEHPDIEKYIYWADEEKKLIEEAERIFCLVYVIIHHIQK